MTPAAPDLIDIPHSGRWSSFRWRRAAELFFLIIGSAIVALLAFAVLRHFAVLPAWAEPFAVWLIFMLEVYLWSARERRRLLARVTELVDANAADPAAALNAIIPVCLDKNVFLVLDHAVQRIRAAGHSGVTVRIAPPAEQGPIDPLRVEFEPIPLNETDPAFVALSAHHTHALGAESNPAPDSNRSPAESDASALRLQVRRVAQLGGMWVWLIFGLMFALAAIEALRRQSVTWALVGWGAAFAFSLFGPALLAASRGRRYLLLPASLLWRELSRRSAAYCLHLFERDRSLLCVYQMRPQLWGWAVADGKKHATNVVTGEEARLLLRAWLSPLPPPPLARLTEFSGN